LTYKFYTFCLHVWNTLDAMVYSITEISTIHTSIKNLLRIMYGSIKSDAGQGTSSFIISLLYNIKGEVKYGTWFNTDRLSLSLSLALSRSLSLSLSLSLWISTTCQSVLAIYNWHKCCSIIIIRSNSVVNPNIIDSYPHHNICQFRPNSKCAALRPSNAIKWYSCSWHTLQY
jgi:hypothetical protein